MEKKDIDWGNLGFGYVKTDYRYVSNYKNGAWDEGGLTTDDTVTISECAGVLQYAQTVFEGMKAYTTEDGRIVTFRPDLNGERMEHSAARLEMPVFRKTVLLTQLFRQLKQMLHMYRHTDQALLYMYVRTCSEATLLSVLSQRTSISSVYSPHRLDHTSKAALSRSQSVSAISTVLHRTEPDISKQALTMQ